MLYEVITLLAELVELAGIDEIIRQAQGLGGQLGIV